MWTDESTPVLVAKYWYDAENRRVRKDVGGDTTLYFLDGMNEVQESDCLGVVAKQYVYGAGVDELVVMDRPLVEAATLSAPCPVFLDAEGEEDAEAQVEACLAPDVDTDSGEEGAWGECGFTSYGLNATEPGFSQSTVVCVSGAWMLVGADAAAPSPASGCMTCDAGFNPGEAANVSVAPGAACSPCGPNLWGTILVDNATEWAVQMTAEQGCNPCPAPRSFEAAFAENSTTPTEPYFHNSTMALRDCVAVNLDARLYFLQDEQRTVYGLADKDGIVREGYEYDPYGTVTVLQPATLLGSVTFTTTDTITTADDAASPYLYAGRRYDSESGLLYFRSRYYDEEMGRFISEDTIGVWGDPDSWGNAYALCGNAAFQCTDPMGERRCWRHFWREHCWKKAAEEVHETLEITVAVVVESAETAGEFVQDTIDEVASWEWVQELGDPDFWKCVAKEAVSIDSAVTIGVAAFASGGTGAAIQGGLVVTGPWSDAGATMKSPLQSVPSSRALNLSPVFTKLPLRQARKQLKRRLALSSSSKLARRNCWDVLFDDREALPVRPSSRHASR